MYTHARQFPHLAGKSDAEIRELARRAMSRRPALIRTMQVRNIVLTFLMAVTPAALVQYAKLDLGVALMVVGAGVMALVLIWNLIWVNRIIFQLTRAEMEREKG